MQDLVRAEVPKATVPQGTQPNLLVQWSSGRRDFFENLVKAIMKIGPPDAKALARPLLDQALARLAPLEDRCNLGR